MYNHSISDVRIGDRVRWESNAGILRGEIVDISLGMNANEGLIPWITIEHMSYVTNRLERVRLCGVHSYLKVMKFIVTFRDVEKQREIL